MEFATQPRSQRTTPTDSEDDALIIGAVRGRKTPEPDDCGVMSPEGTSPENKQNYLELEQLLATC